MIRKSKNYLLLFIVILIILIQISYANTFKSSVNIESISNFTFDYSSVTSESPVAGYHTSIEINSLSTTSHWKAIVGNVSGKVVFGDMNDQTLLLWNVSHLKGKIFCTKNDTVFDWTGVTCATREEIYEEENELNIDSKSVDSINNTFSGNNHIPFNAALVHFEEDECLSITTNINDESQDNNFFEVLLHNGNDLLYAALLENDQQGYNGKSYDFQFILPNYYNLDSEIDTIYYFYVELD